MVIVALFLNVVDYHPEMKHLNRHIRDKVCDAGSEKLLDLGIELLDNENVTALHVIKSDATKGLNERCSEMFTLWLNRQPKASWRNLVMALKKIHMDTLASDVEKLLEQTSEEIDTADRQILQEDQRTQLSSEKGTSV